MPSDGPERAGLGRQGQGEHFALAGAYNELETRPGLNPGLQVRLRENRWGPWAWQVQAKAICSGCGPLCPTLSLSPFVVTVTPACGTQEPLALFCSFSVLTARELAARTRQQGESSSPLVCLLVARTVLGAWNLTTNTLLSLGPQEEADKNAGRDEIMD